MELALPKAASIASLIRKDVPPSADWIAPGILPKGGKLLFGGHAKVGKSLVLLEMARALATGTPAFRNPFFQIPQPARVLMFEQELGEYGLQKRVKKIYKDEDETLLDTNLYYVSKQPAIKLDTPEGRNLIYQLIDKVQPNVLMLDPMGKLHHMDENSSKDMTKLFDHLDGIIRKYKHLDLSIVMSHHAGKNEPDKDKARDPLDPYSFRGSSKWYDEMDALMMCQRMADLPEKVDKETGRPYKPWRIKSRFTLRHAEPPEDDMWFIANKDNDLKVIWERTGNRAATPLVTVIKKEPVDPNKPKPKQVFLFPAI